METIVRILILEDNTSDAELMKRELRKSGLNFTAELAHDKISFHNALDKFIPDIILADYSLPEFDGLSATVMARQHFPNTPVIIVSGAVGEETAIEALRAGATDYVLKDRLKRIVPVVNRALNEAKLLAEHKKAEDAVRQRAELLKLSFDAIIVWRLNGHIETWNRGAEKLYGFSEKEALGRDILELLKTLHPIPRPEIKNILRKHGQWEGELRHKTKNNTEITVLSRLQLVQGTHGDDYVLETNRDISERKKAEHILKRDKETFEKLVHERTSQLVEAQVELEKSKRLSDIGVLAATVAHELRNPLAAISMAAYNIKRKAKNPDLDKHLVNIEKKVRESDQIINNLLFYSRLKPPNYETCSIFAIIEESIESIEDKLKKDVEIIRNIDSLKGISIEADPLQIKEVFHNILNNAHDAVPSEKGRISITAENEDEFIKVIIEDNGTGVGKDILDKVFDPFFTTKAKGTGLGLSVSRQIVKMHKGEIGIKSESGQGTSIIVRLRKKERKKERING